MNKFDNLNKLVLYLKNKKGMTKQNTYTDERDIKGKKGEMRFAKILWSIYVPQGFSIYAATSEEDWQGHWDIAIEKDGNVSRFDVKNNMTQNRGTIIFSIWAEIQNTSGDPGSLLGLADYIAYMHMSKDEFIVVDRKEIVKLVERKTKLSTEEILNLRIYHEEGYRRRYLATRRKNVNDIIFKVPIEDIKEEIMGTNIFSEGSKKLFRKPNQQESQSMFF